MRKKWIEKGKVKALIKFGSKEMTVTHWIRELHISSAGWYAYRRKGFSNEETISHFIELAKKAERKRERKITELKIKSACRKFQKMKEAHDNAQTEIHDGLKGFGW